MLKNLLLVIVGLCASTPLDSRTRATFLRAELGFFGVIVFT